MIKLFRSTILKPLNWTVTRMLHDMEEYKNTIITLVLLGQVTYIRDVKFCDTMIILLSKLKSITTMGDGL